MTETWDRCKRITWDGSGIKASLCDALDTIFRLDIYGNVVSLYSLPNNICSGAYDHFFPYSRGIVVFLVNIRRKDKKG